MVTAVERDRDGLLRDLGPAAGAVVVVVFRGGAAGQAETGMKNEGVSGALLWSYMYSRNRI